MAAFYILNAIASAIVCGGLTFAIISKHVCDGVLIKKALVACAIGFAANAVTPSLNSILWITVSFAALVIFVLIRCIQAHFTHQKPIFIK